MISTFGSRRKDDIRSGVGVVQALLCAAIYMGKGFQQGADACDALVLGQAVGFLLREVLQGFLFCLIHTRRVQVQVAGAVQVGKGSGGIQVE